MLFVLKASPTVLVEHPLLVEGLKFAANALTLSKSSLIQ
ncbi:hypothetical protein D082_17670 [Synechocystis sp. PCC 6714]|nr:hypothetical protein D082_17670 [Synechocystis sp. PCC 6714]